LILVKETDRKVEDLTKWWWR